MEWLQGLTMVDYVVLSVLAISFVLGWVRGLVLVLANLIVFLVSVFVAGLYTDHTVQWLNRTWGVQEKIAAALERRIELPPEAYKVPTGSIPWAKAAEWLRDVPLPESFKVALAERVEQWSAGLGVQTAANYMIDQVAAGVLHSVVFIGLTLLIGWVLGMLGRLVNDQIKELPLVGTVNRLAGAAAIVFQSTAILSVLFALVAPMISLYGLGSLAETMSSSWSAPHLLRFYEWIRGFLIPLGGATFFTG